VETNALPLAKGIILPSAKVNLTGGGRRTYMFECLEHVLHGVAHLPFLINVRQFFIAGLIRALKENGLIALVFKQKLLSTFNTRQIGRVAGSAAHRRMRLLLVRKLSVDSFDQSVVEHLVPHLLTIFRPARPVRTTFHVA
jgi:hypothetical protein